MAYKIRNTLKNRMEVAFAAAAKKEGREITVEPLGRTILKGEDIAYRGNDNYLLKDGRYVTRFWDGENDVNPLMLIDNLPADVLRSMAENDHYVATQRRWKEDHEDYEYQNYLKRLDAGETNLTNPMDRCPVWDVYPGDGSGEDDVDDIVDDVDDEGFDYSLKPVRRPGHDTSAPTIGFAPDGSFNAETRKELHKILRGFLRELSPEKYKWFKLLFSSKISQKQWAEMEGVSEAAISKRKRWYEDKAADYFRSLGYPALTRPERNAEGKKRQKEVETYEKHYAEVSKALREIYCPENDEETATA